MRIGSHDTHPAADAFPLMDEHALAVLVDDIKANGLRNPIVLLDGQVLDGRNRYLACIKAGIVPEFDEYTGDDPIGYVASVNLIRRHQEDGSRALSARRLVRLATKQARIAKVQPSLGWVDKEEDALAKRLEQGTPELVEAVERGDLTLGAGAMLADRDEEEQRKAVGMVEAEKQRAEQPVRARSEADYVLSKEVKLMPVDITAVRALLLYAEKSRHGEVAMGCEVVRKVCGL